MELRQLRSFVEVVRAGTYGAAAERLHVSQPALWKQVRQLQVELGVELFVRDGRKVALTDSGESLAARAEQALVAADAIRALADDLRAGRAGSVRIACTGPHLQRCMARIIAQFQQRHPGIRVILTEQAILDPQAALDSMAFDVVASGGGSGRPGLELYEVSIACPVPASHPFAGRESIDVRALRDVALVTAPPGFLSRSELDRACSAARFDPVIVAESASPGALVAMGREGLGVPVIANDAMPDTAQAPLLELDGARLGGSAWLFWADHPSHATQNFVAVARDVLAGHDQVSTNA